MSKNENMKGMSLALETVILLILMAVVLAALLAFFLGVFNPSKSQLDNIKNKESFCVQYVSRDPGCSNAHAISEASEDPYKDSAKYGPAKTAIDQLKAICKSNSENPPCGTKDCSQAEAVIKACCPTYC